MPPTSNKPTSSNRTATTKRASALEQDGSPRLSIRPRRMEEIDSEFIPAPVNERVSYERRIKALEQQLNETTNQLSSALSELIESRQARRDEAERFQKQLSDLIDANRRLTNLAVDRRTPRQLDAA